MARLSLIAALALLTGCTHQQLRYSTVKYAHTVADVHTQQVLDNLAKFAHNPGALPHFSFPNAGASSVMDGLDGRAEFMFLPARLKDWGVNLGAERGIEATYQMTPINDPRKLELMRCAYQRSVSTCCGAGESIHCPDCEKRLNKFYLGSETVSDTFRFHNGEPVYRVNLCGGKPDETDSTIDVYQLLDKNGNARYYRISNNTEVLGDHLIFEPATTKTTVASLTTKTGNVTAWCLHAPCWFCVGKKRDVPHCDRCALVGHYCGTYVWVPEAGRDELTKLTLTVLDIALNDPPASRQKEVIAFLDQQGLPTKNRDDATFEVHAHVPLSSHVKTVAPRPHIVPGDAVFSRSLETYRRLSMETKDLSMRSTEPDQLKHLPNASSRELREILDTFAEDRDTAHKTLESARDRGAADRKKEAIKEMEQQLRNMVLVRESQEEATLVEQQSIERLPPTQTPIPGAGYLQFDRNLRAVSPQW